MNNVRKAVFPVAGFGSRFLPATKASPKEMLPIVDKPLIQYAVEEAIRAGITHMIFITSSSKRAIEDHFDRHFELEMHLRERDEVALLDLVKRISPSGIQFTYIRQSQPLGLGHAVLCAEQVVGDEPFVVLLADDLIDDSKMPCLSAMVECFEQDGHSILAVQSVPKEDVSKYGVVSVLDEALDYTRISNVVEKPEPETVSSNLVSIGRYLFTSAIFSQLKTISADRRGEFQLSDAIQQLLKQEKVSAYHFRGKRYDCGSKLGYLQAVVELGMQHEEIGMDFKRYLMSISACSGSSLP